MTESTRTEQRALLRAAIARSGRSSASFAIEVLVRDPRTVRRWLAGDLPIPALVLEKLRQLVAGTG